MDYFFYCEENENNLERFKEFIEENCIEEYVDFSGDFPKVQVGWMISGGKQEAWLDSDTYVFVDSWSLIVVPSCKCNVFMLD